MLTFIYVFYLKIRMTEREREKEEEEEESLNTYNSQGGPDWSQVPGTPLGLPCVWQELKSLNCDLLSSRSISRKLSWKWRQDLIPGTLIALVGVARGSF